MATTLQAPPPIPGQPTQAPSSLLPTKPSRSRPLFDPEILKRATRDSFVKLNPVTLLRNPVIFVVEVGAALVTVFLVRSFYRRSRTGL